MFEYVEYTVSPDFCTLTVTCESVTNPTNDVFPGTLTKLSCPENPFSGTLTQNFVESDYSDGLAPGDYQFFFKVSTGGSDPALNPEFDITFTLTDICDPIDELTNTVEDIMYVIGDPMI